MEANRKTLYKEAASTLVKGVMELGVGQGRLDERQAEALTGFLASTIELLDSGRATRGEVAVVLVQKQLGIAALSGLDAAACASALTGLVTAMKPRVQFSRAAFVFPVAGIAAVVASALLVLGDALEVYGRCYLPVRERFLVGIAEEQARERYRAARARTRPLTDAEVVGLLGRIGRQASPAPLGGVLP